MRPFDLIEHLDHDIQVSEAERRYYYTEIKYVDGQPYLDLFDSTSGDGEGDYIVHCSCGIEGSLGDIELDFT